MELRAEHPLRVEQHRNLVVGIDHVVGADHDGIAALDRERRRGQLVMGGRAGDFVYLRGDRLAPDDLLDFRIADD